MAASSPMAKSSRMSGASDAPPLTVGTTASTSPSPLSPSGSPLTPPPVKRKSPSAASASAGPAKRAKGDTGGDTEKAIYCHQCRTKCEAENVLRCTKPRTYVKSTAQRACNLAWCERDLKLRYGVDAGDVRRRAGKAGYVFECPCCLDYCQNSTCRLKKGLPKLGDIVKQSKETGLSVMELAAKADAEGKAAGKAGKATKGKGKETTGKGKATTTGKGKAMTEKKGKAATIKGKTATTKGKTTAKNDPKDKTKTKAKGKAKPAAEREPGAPVNILAPKVDPPVLHNMDSRMGRAEAEQRMYVREFVNRFRHLLHLPDRSLGPLDDLDHPLSETTVRIVAGALLDLVLAEAEQKNDYSILEVVEERREELRHFADLARFAQVYNSIAGYLELRLPPDPNLEAKEQNDRTMRALLDIGDGESTPAWATETGPSRRTAASRLPSPSEVVRMLISIMDYVIELDKVRRDMDPGVGFSMSDAVRRLHDKQQKEFKRWAVEKKKLSDATQAARGAPSKKRAKDKFNAQEQQHQLNLKLGQVSHEAVLARKTTGFEPLGTDVDGRVYYALTPRLIEEDRYRPSGWARGVVIWGRAMEGQTDDEDMPAMVERWMIVDSAADVQRLARWVTYRWRDLHNKLEWEEYEAAKAGGEKSNITNGSPAAPAAPLDDSDSDLSPAPDDSLLQLLNMKPPKPDSKTVEYEGYRLEFALAGTAKFLEVLEGFTTR